MSPTYEESHISLLAPSIDEKWAAEQDELVNSNDLPAKGHSCCRSGRRRKALLRAGLIALVVLLISIASCVAMTILCPGAHSLMKRQNNGSTNNGDNGSAFTNQHLWIIIVCVVGNVRSMR